MLVYVYNSQGKPLFFWAFWLNQTIYFIVMTQRNNIQYEHSAVFMNCCCPSTTYRSMLVPPVEKPQSFRAEQPLKQAKISLKKSFSKHDIYSKAPSDIGSVSIYPRFKKEVSKSNEQQKNYFQPRNVSQIQISQPSAPEPSVSMYTPASRPESRLERPLIFKPAGPPSVQMTRIHRGSLAYINPNRSVLVPTIKIQNKLENSYGSQPVGQLLVKTTRLERLPLNYSTELKKTLKKPDFVTKEPTIKKEMISKRDQVLIKKVGAKEQRQRAGLFVQESRKTLLNMKASVCSLVEEEGLGERQEQSEVLLDYFHPSEMRLKEMENILGPSRA